MKSPERKSDISASKARSGRIENSAEMPDRIFTIYGELGSFWQLDDVKIPKED
ncbi:MAG: hypothetical protein KDD59_14275 [Bdellovibrionales bacterium]|nr:hypothetical protein [Bdellovibrionales bacterium]